MRAKLRRYLLLPQAQRKTDPNRAAFEPFLREVGLLFALREAAIVRFRENRWIAKQERGALPLPWEMVGETLDPTVPTPQAGLETTLARELPPMLQAVFERLRKVLRREREPQAIGRVEQIDPTCLRWLTRQPGYSVEQKAGARQRVLAVVRREHYDLLENRVLRDLLLRTERLAERWLEAFEADFPNHGSVRGVRRLAAMCREGLRLEPLQTVAPLTDIPTPNYVLSQDALYRRVWDAYLLVIHYYRLAEGLWERHAELHSTLARWRTSVATYRDSFYRTELWVCPIKANQPWTEETSHFIVTRPAQRPLLQKQEGPVAIDLLGMRLADVLLWPDARHPNAKPRLIDLGAPYVDFDPAEEEAHRARGHYLANVLRHAHRGAPSQAERHFLAVYFEQLRGALGGARWVVLVADEWTPEWLEAIRQAAAQAIGDRSRVSLLWRTIAYALGRADCPASLTVPRLCGSNPDRADLEYDHEGRPCHRAYRFTEQSALGNHLSIPKANRTLFDWLWEPGKTDETCAAILSRGALRFLEAQAKHEVAYWDELMGLYVVYQTQDEHVRFRTLVEYNRYFKGGSDYVGAENRDFNLKENAGLKLYLLEAEQEDARGELKLFERRLEKIAGDDPLRMRAKVSPGQGVVRLEIAHSSLPHPEEIALEGLANTTDTLNTLENTIDRSFPPHSPKVIADGGLLSFTERKAIERFANGDRIALDGAIFAKARYRYPSNQPLPSGASPLERLRRFNVFGAEKDWRTPRLRIDFQALFTRLHGQANREIRAGIYNHALRQIAWTYQFDNPLFDDLRKTCVALVCDGEKSDPELITFCANLCARPDEWRRLFDSCMDFFRTKQVGCPARQRLLGCLLMFNETFIETIMDRQRSQRDTISSLVWTLCKTSIEASKSQRNDCLRCLLYLLRIRRFDGKRFAMKGVDDANHDRIAAICQEDRYPGDGGNTPPYRRALRHYLEGNGRLDDIPQDSP